MGDAKVRGISGGEKKRLSLACELIASPSVIFADEPTTGTCFSFMQLLLNNSLVMVSFRVTIKHAVVGVGFKHMMLQTSNMNYILSDICVNRYSLMLNLNNSRI